ncbi:predicted protein [Chaetomium globosum CBS 148.51]|uniref:Uncharacterized protein n=1 Tax=Chaetomium globosum (strain ATCC 6205 / CBS 148.51 / DSM 1962 / NBRC 6347 / NRRL 1970) TaxID=306901 RepID=Q2H8C3_CHAGB|nr:uncharacterized protein CHGG_03531 [Chaetomium globosum CBS 148.51]EAQ91596.1 predicted protein [Chaetomium globosum CBS 148.51]
MSAEAPKIEAQAEQVQEQQQQHQEQDDQASITSKPNQEGDEATPAAGEEKAAKPNPLKKLGSVFKTVFACLRKPAVRDEEKIAAEADEKNAAAAAGGDDDEEDALKKAGDATQAPPVIEQGVLSGEPNKEGTAPHS